MADHYHLTFVLIVEEINSAPSHDLLRITVWPDTAVALVYFCIFKWCQTEWMAPVNNHLAFLCSCWCERLIWLPIRISCVLWLHRSSAKQWKSPGNTFTLIKYECPHNPIISALRCHPPVSVYLHPALTLPFHCSPLWNSPLSSSLLLTPPHTNLFSHIEVLLSHSISTAPMGLPVEWKHPR